MKSVYDGLNCDMLSAQILQEKYNKRLPLIPNGTEIANPLLSRTTGTSHDSSVELCSKLSVGPDMLFEARFDYQSKYRFAVKHNLAVQ